MRIIRTVFLLLILIGVHFSIYAQNEAGRAEAKYVFLFIGDGMGLAQVNATEAYLAELQGKIGLERLNFTSFPEVGLVNTYAANRLITCSAAAGTALATGHKTNIDRIGVSPDGKEAYESIAVKAKKAGYRVGIVTSVSIDHATPAAFYAHQVDRDMYFEIGTELAGSNFDYFAGGGFITPDGTFGGNPVNLIQLAKDSGYQVVNTRAAFEQLAPGSGKALVISPRVAGGTSLPYSIDMNPNDLTLADFTAKGIQMLDNEKGFFMMVEGGKIDWAGHDNDAATVLHEVRAFDEAIGKAVEFYRQHPEETLIVVTADHETGGMALGHRETRYDSNLELLKYQRSSEEEMIRIAEDFRKNKTADTIAEFNRMLKVMENELGLNSRLHETVLDSAETAVLLGYFKAGIYQAGDQKEKYSDSNPFISEAVVLMNKRAGISWGTGSHTGVNVPVYATGTGAEEFSGYMDNTDIPRRIGEILNFEF